MFTARSLRSLLLLTLLAPLASAGDYVVRLTGSVVPGSVFGPVPAPFDQVQSGDPVVVELSVVSPPALDLGNAVFYAFDRSGSSMQVGGQTSLFSSVDSYPGFGDLAVVNGAPDSVEASGVLLGDQLVCDFQLQDFTGLMLGSADLGQEVGSTTSSFSFSIAFCSSASGAPLFSIQPQTLQVLADASGRGTTGCDGGGPCPCGNPGDPGAGCANSVGAGARLLSSGFPSVTNDSLGFGVSAMPPGQPVLLISGQNLLGGGAGVPFGDGLRCVGGGVRRLGISVTDASGTATWAAGTSVVSQASAGQILHYQAWYRDQVHGGCGARFNLSQAVSHIWFP